MDLPDRLYQSVLLLSKQADELVNADRFDEAIEKYEAAWNLLPDTKETWRAATWLLVSLGDARFYKGEFGEALANYMHAMSCPGALGNPYIHLRLGQSHFETGNEQKAADELARAYMGAGEDVFDAQDPKYLAFLKQKLLPPATN
jgi:tetratricopeptide (TPR) repeat protein